MTKQNKSTDAHNTIIEQSSEFLKERIYATITLLALLATLWQAADHFTARGAAFSVLGTVIALWMAIGIAERMSYQVIHGKQMSARVYGSILWTHSALLVPALPVLILIGFSGLGLISLSGALLTSMIVLLFSFAVFSLLAGRRIHTTWYEVIVSTLYEIALGIGVIILKIVAGH